MRNNHLLKIKLITKAAFATFHSAIISCFLFPEITIWTGIHRPTSKFHWTRGGHAVPRITLLVAVMPSRGAPLYDIGKLELPPLFGHGPLSCLIYPIDVCTTLSDESLMFSLPTVFINNNKFLVAIRQVDAPVEEHLYQQAMNLSKRCSAHDATTTFLSMNTYVYIHLRWRLRRNNNEYVCASVAAANWIRPCVRLPNLSPSHREEGRCCFCLANNKGGPFVLVCVRVQVEYRRASGAPQKLPITLCETVVMPTSYRIFSAENKSINSHRASKLEYLTAIKREDGMPWSYDGVDQTAHNVLLYYEARLQCYLHVVCKSTYSDPI